MEKVMRDIEPGMFARSKAGHDKGMLYLVWKAQGEYVYLIDGVRRTLENPKKKNCRHVQIIYRSLDGWNPKELKDEDVKRGIRLYEKNESGQTNI